MSEPRRSGCGGFIAVAGLIGWATMAIKWLSHWYVLVPVLVLVVGALILVAAGDGDGGTH